MLQTKSNVFIAGHHPSKLDPRFDLIQTIKPDILAVDKPQDLRPYAERVRSGDSATAVAEALFSETIMDPDLFYRDCMRLHNTCQIVGIKEVYFVDIPSYIRNIIPLYLDDEFGDQTTRERIMALRLKEIELKSGGEKKIMMLVQDILQLNIYQHMERMSDYDLAKVRDDKEKLCDRLLELLSDQLKDEPMCLGSSHYENTKKRTLSVLDQVEAAFHLILRDLNSGSLPFEPAYAEAKRLVDQLQELNFRIFKLTADPQDSEFVSRLQRGKTQLDNSIQEGFLKEDLLVEY